MEVERFESNGPTLHYCKVSARFHSLTEMSRDRNGQTESARPNWPDRIGQTEKLRPKRLRPKRPDRIGQTEKSCSVSDRKENEKRKTKLKNISFILNKGVNLHSVMVFSGIAGNFVTATFLRGTMFFFKFRVKHNNGVLGSIFCNFFLGNATVCHFHFKLSISRFCFSFTPLVTAL